MHRITGGRKRCPPLSARRWIQKITRAMESRGFPLEKFVLVPPVRREEKARKS